MKWTSSPRYWHAFSKNEYRIIIGQRYIIVDLPGYNTIYITAYGSVEQMKHDIEKALS